MTTKIHQHLVTKKMGGGRRLRGDDEAGDGGG
jgi:hypothetical protein